MNDRTTINLVDCHFHFYAGEDLDGSLDRIGQQIQTNAMQIRDAVAAILQIGEVLSKVKGEITRKLDELETVIRTQQTELPPEAVEAIQKVRDIANALDGIVPDVNAEQPNPPEIGNPGSPLNIRPPGGTNPLTDPATVAATAVDVGIAPGRPIAPGA